MESDNESDRLEKTIPEDNFKCGNFKCGHKFRLENKQTMIRCPECGHRILYKLRTKNHISYKTN
jgi:DNA-directed RNA polymerase subunit RPC12/RpoP